MERDRQDGAPHLYMADAALFSPLGLLGLGSPAMLISAWREEAESDAGSTAGYPNTYHPHARERFLRAYVRYTWTALTKTTNRGLHTLDSYPHITEIGLFTNPYTFRHLHTHAHKHVTHIHTPWTSHTPALSSILVYINTSNTDHSHTWACIQVIKSHTKITHILSVYRDLTPTSIYITAHIQMSHCTFKQCSTEHLYTWNDA